MSIVINNRRQWRWYTSAKFVMWSRHIRWWYVRWWLNLNFHVKFMINVNRLYRSDLSLVIMARLGALRRCARCIGGEDWQENIYVWQCCEWSQVFLAAPVRWQIGHFLSLEVNLDYWLAAQMMWAFAIYWRRQYLLHHL